MSDLTHLDKNGNIRMVNVGNKEVTHRTAVAQSILVMPVEVLSKFTDGDIQTKKGSVFQAAKIAGIMAAKKTSELIPLCHQIPLTHCNIDLQLKDDELVIECRVETDAKTGVEMEALVGVSAAALTVYDMCKALSHDITIRETKLLHKSGGKNDFDRR